MKHLFILLLSIFISQVNAQEYYGGVEGQKLDWLFYYLQKNYVDSLDNSNLADLAIQRVVEELDPFSSYQSKEQVEAQMNHDQGLSSDLHGFQFYLIKGQKPIITYVSKNGPAEKAGLRRGFELLQVNNKPLSGLYKSEIQAIIDDTMYQQLKIDYLDLDGNRKTADYPKGYSPWFSVVSNYMLTDNIGYIKLYNFNKNTTDEFKYAIESLKSQGMQNLVLDLRNNSGGVKDQAISLADQFLEQGKLIHYEKGFNLEYSASHSTAEGVFKNGKVVCLTNDYTSSASEIFLAALQEWDRALLLGYPTYGKGLIQQSFKLGDGSNIRLTIGRYYSPLGRILQKPLNDNWFVNQIKLIPKDGILANALFDSNFFVQSHKGRVLVAGTGGIYPDVYFIDPQQNTVALDKYNSNGEIYRFTTNYIHQNRKSLTDKYSSIQDLFNDNTFLANLSKSFVAHLKEKNYPEANDANFGIPRNILDLSTTWIASQLWNDNAYYQAFNKNNPTIQKSIQMIEEDWFKKVGLNY